MIISAGADVEAQNERHERPLHASATYGHPAVVKLLLARGAGVDARGPGGKTPLHAAAFGVGLPSDADARFNYEVLL
jgi:ankyrin repeat protein